MATNRKTVFVDEHELQTKTNYQKLQNEQDEDLSLMGIQVDWEDSLYDALQKKGLLQQPGFPAWWGLHLVKQGEVGLCMDNGRPVFLSPGRYTFESPFKEYLGTKSISDPLIELGSIQIVTIKQGEIGLSVKNGENIILEPGRYILEAPHKFEKTAKTDQRYVHLGTYHRISVDQGYVAIARVDGRQIIIYPNKDGTQKPFTINSNTFYFDEKTGFQRTMKQNVELEPLKVNTNDGVSANVEGIITYEISDPELAFFGSFDVHPSIKHLAEATLTGVYSHLDIGEVNSGLFTAQTTSFSEKGKEKNEDEINHDDLLHEATSMFLDDFQKTVTKWGVKVHDLKIEKMEWEKQFADDLRKRTQDNLKAATNLMNVGATNEVKVKEAECKAETRRREAQGEADAIVTIAEAKSKAATLEMHAAQELAKEPVAVAIKMKELDVKIIEKVGNNAIYIPTDFGVYGLNRVQGPMLFRQPDMRSQQPVQSSELAETATYRLPMMSGGSSG